MTMLVKKLNKDTFSIINDIKHLLNKINNKYDYISEIIIQEYNIDLILLTLLNEKKDILEKCYSYIYKIMTLFPPKKNENKFIYGKLVEKIIINTINKIISCYELDSLYETGSCYKNYCCILSSYYRIKVIKSKSDVIILNKNHKQDHKISDMSFIICDIQKQRLYIFTYSDDYKKYIHNKETNISFRSSIFTYLDNNTRNYIDFPTCCSEIEKISKLNEINIYEYLLKEFII